MTEEEKRISFMNRYFVFKKVRNVNTDKIAKIVEQQQKLADNIEEVISQDIEEMESKEKAATIDVVKPVIRKIKKPKIVLEKFSTDSEAAAPPVQAVQEPPKKITIKKPVLKSAQP